MAGIDRRVRGLAAAAAFVALIAPDAALGARADTTVSITSKVPAFHGKVSSPDDACRKGRSVQLYRRVAGSGKKRIGRTSTNKGGRWVVPVDELTSGAYFAKVKGNKTCRSAKTESVVVD